MNRTMISSTLLLVLAAACGPSGVTSTPSPASSTAPVPSVPSAAAATLDVTLADFAITPAELTATAGSVSFGVENEGPTPHNLTIRDAADAVVAATADLSRMESETISADLTADEYVFFCSLPGHESLGMAGTLAVTAP